MRSTEVSKIKFELYENRTGKSKYYVYDTLRELKQTNFNLRNKQLINENKSLFSPATKSRKRNNFLGLVEVVDHPVLRLLAKPNPFMSKRAFMHRLSQHVDLTGNAFVYLVGAGNQPQEMWLLHPSNMRVIKSATNFNDHYEYFNNGSYQRLSVNEVIHFQDPDPSDMHMGIGMVRTGGTAISTDAQAGNYNNRFLSNAAMPRHVFKTDKLISEEAEANIKRSFNGNYAGTDNAGKAIFLEDGLTPVNLSLTQADMEFTDGRRFGRDEILAQTNVSGANLGIQESSNRATAEAADYTLGKRVVDNRMDMINDTMFFFLLPFFSDNYILTYENPVPRDRALEIEEKSKAVDKWRTRNEIRATEGRTPVAGGNTLLRQQQDVRLNAPFVQSGQVDPQQSGDQGDDSASEQ